MEEGKERRREERAENARRYSRRSPRNNARPRVMFVASNRELVRRCIVERVLSSRVTINHGEFNKLQRAARNNTHIPGEFIHAYCALAARQCVFPSFFFFFLFSSLSYRPHIRPRSFFQAFNCCLSRLRALPARFRARKARRMPQTRPGVNHSTDPRRDDGCGNASPSQLARWWLDAAI